MRLFESPYFRSLPIDNSDYRSLDGIGSAIWLVVITLTSVGYGDIFPCTIPGRIVAIIIAIVGTLLIALKVTIVT